MKQTKKKDPPYIPEEDFTEEEIKYINEPLTRRDIEWLVSYEGNKKEPINDSSKTTMSSVNGT